MGLFGVGKDLAHTVWPEQEFRFSSQQKPLETTEKTAAKELGPPNRVPPTILTQYPVNCLLIDACEIKVWSPWISSTTFLKRPEVILFFTDVKHLENESEAASKKYRKLMERMGYSIRFWLMEACAFGAAVAQLRLGVMYTKQETSGGDYGPKQPIPNQLPARPMSNLLLPFGVPMAAWTKMVPNSLGAGRTCLPCISHLKFGRAPIYDPQGLMPDTLDSWVQVEKGFRHLQVEELAKAKGVPKDWTPASRKKRGAWRTVISRLAVVHLWTATMDSLGDWMRTRSSHEISNNDDPSISK
jgi:hypothetical protein